MGAGFRIRRSPEQIKASLYKKHNCLLSDWPANWFMQLCIGRFAITSSNSLFFLRKAYPIARTPSGLPEMLACKRGAAIGDSFAGLQIRARDAGAKASQESPPQPLGRVANPRIPLLPFRIHRRNHDVLCRHARLAGNDVFDLRPVGIA